MEKELQKEVDKPTDWEKELRGYRLKNAQSINGQFDVMAVEVSA